jgi:hypothetical protein
MWADIIDGANTELPNTTDEDIRLPTYKHVTATITYPVTSCPLPPMVANYPHAQGFFDGGAGKRPTKLAPGVLSSLIVQGSAYWPRLGLVDKS